MVILSNLETINANVIDDNVKQSERLERLNDIARKELSILSNDKKIIGIERLDNYFN